MSTVKRMKVSFIDKDTMCAVDPDLVEVYTDIKGELIGHTIKDGKEIELEIKFLEYL